MTAMEDRRLPLVYMELQFNDPTGIAISGDIMYVVEHNGSRIDKLTLEGGFLGAFGSIGSGKGQFNNSLAICIGPAGRIYVADYSNDCIHYPGISSR